MNPSDRFSEEQVRALIARAIELDAREHGSTAEDIRAIATELGITAWFARIFRRETITLLRHGTPLQVPRPG